MKRITLQACIVCGGEPTLLCDFQLGGVIGGTAKDRNGNEYLCFDARKMPYTCDVHLCDRCAIHKGNIFFCGKRGCIETIDYCPYHAAIPEPYIEPITPEAAKSMRRLVHAHYHRKGFALV